MIDDKNKARKGHSTGHFYISAVPATPAVNPALKQAQRTVSGSTPHAATAPPGGDDSGGSGGAWVVFFLLLLAAGVAAVVWGMRKSGAKSLEEFVRGLISKRTAVGDSGHEMQATKSAKSDALGF